jgi:hypothetical protein
MTMLTLLARIGILSIFLAAIVMFPSAGASWADGMTRLDFSLGVGFVTAAIHAGSYPLVDTPDGSSFENLDAGEGSFWLKPGCPLLPAENVLLLLPPGARFESVDAVVTGSSQLPSSYWLKSAPPLLPLAGSSHSREMTQQIMEEWEQQRRAIYSQDEAYPHEVVQVIGSGTLRQYSYVAISFCPFTYHPRSGRLYRHSGVQLHLKYDIPAEGSAQSQEIRDLLNDTAATARAERLFANYEQMREQYLPTEAAPAKGRATHDYVIVTTTELLPAVLASDFVAHKTALGFTVRIVQTSDAQIATQPGGDLAEQIRNFLRAYYAVWGIEYVLLVGDYTSIPMRYCFADPDDHSHDPLSYPNPGGSVPTDHYYADLSYADDVSWDADGDGYYGEYEQDTPDLLAEVSVGRIPTSDSARITYTLDKLVRVEQDTGGWKSQALHGGAILFFENQDYMGIPFRDGAVCLDLIETNLLTGWPVSRYSEQAGLSPSTYPWPAITEEAFTSDWRGGQYGVVNWAGHGSPDAAWRTVWTWDDGDGVFETDGSDGVESLAFIGEWCDVDDDYPSIVFAVSCNVGFPEPNGRGNLGVDLLTDPTLGAAAGVVSSTRIAAVTGDWPATLGGAESMCYEFNRYFIAGPTGPAKLGDAFYDSKYFCHFYYGWQHYLQYWNMYDYNLYGDPAMERVLTITAVETANVGRTVPSLWNQPNPFNPRTNIHYRLVTSSLVRLSIYDVRGRQVRVLLRDTVQSPGNQVAVWDGLDDAGRQLPSGTYFCYLKTSEVTRTVKLTLVR